MRVSAGLKQALAFASYCVAFFSMSYVALNFGAIKADIGEKIFSNGAEQPVETVLQNDGDQPSFVLFSEASKDSEYSSFPGMDQALAFADILKSVSVGIDGSDAMVGIPKTESVGIDAESKKPPKIDITDLSVEMSADEWKKYGNASFLAIPSLKIEAPISFPSVESYDLEGVILKDLEKGVAHRPETQLPTQNGNFFVIGHSSNYPWIRSKYNNVFAKIPKMKDGDEAYVFYQGRKFVYETYAKFVVPADALDVYGYIPGYNMSLMTCYPIGTDQSRMIVRLKLKSKA